MGATLSGIASAEENAAKMERGQYRRNTRSAERKNGESPMMGGGRKSRRGGRKSRKANTRKRR